MTRIRMVGTGVVLMIALAVGFHRSADAQVQAREADVASPEAIVNAAYDVIARPPGAQFDWDRFRSLFLPSANLIPNTEQTGGEFRVMTVEDFISWADGSMPIGGPDDHGFQEEAVANHVEQYGDIAHVFSVYEKRFWDSEEVLGRGINTFQLVHHEGRWWIAGIAWDEETSGIAIPERYLR